MKLFLYLNSDRVYKQNLYQICFENLFFLAISWFQFVWNGDVWSVPFQENKPTKRRCLFRNKRMLLLPLVSLNHRTKFMSSHLQFSLSKFVIAIFVLISRLGFFCKFRYSNFIGSCCYSSVIVIK